MKRVLVADDSSLMRRLVSDTLRGEGFEVLTASNGKEAVELAAKNKPDAAVLDVRMPVMDGLAALKEFVSTGIPTVMFSSLTKEDSQVTMDALEVGAFDFVPKPGGTVTLDISEVRDDLIRKVRAAVISKKIPILRPKTGKSGRVEGVHAPASSVLLIAASTGGPSFVKALVQSLGSDLEAAVLIVQHMPPVFTKFFAERIASGSRIPVKEGEEDDEVRAGLAFLAPGDYHMEVTSDPVARLSLNKGPKVNYVRPSADPLFISAARRFGRRVVAVILSGMGSDAKDGALAVKSFGGHVIAQDETTSVVYGMPRAVIEAGATDEVLPFDEIPKRVNEILSRLA